MVARLHYWLLTHPHVARPVTVMGLLQVLSCWAVGAAPDAAASSNAVVLNWTGLHDTYGVPVGDMYLSLANLRDQLTQTGPDASMVDPTTWWSWMMHGVAVMFDNLTAANILTAEISLFVGIVTVALWVFRLTVSTYWLTVLGELARAITTAVVGVVSRWGLVAITVPVGVFLGVLAIRRGEHGRGATMILLAIFMPALAVSVFSDPAGLMYGPNGLLQFGRRMAFSTAQAATHGGAIADGGFTGQIDTLTSSLITHVVREPLEVFNFGHVVDNVGGCAAMVSAAWKQGATDGPITALARCGDTAAVHYAQHLDGTNVVGGAILVVTTFLFGWFMVSSGASVFMVSVKAIYTTAKLLPTVFAGGIDGAAREHAKSTVWKYFKHPIEAMVFITFVSVIGLAIERVISRPLPAELGGANPFAHIVVMGGASLVALYLLRHIRADLDGGHPGRGLLGRASDVALGLGMHAALGGAGTAALGGTHGLRGLLGRGKAPWEKLDEKATSQDAQQILGPAQDGFDPVPGDAGSGGADREGPTGSVAAPGGDLGGGGGGVPVLNPPDSAREGLNPVSPRSASGGVPDDELAHRSRRGNRAQRAGAAAQTAFDGGDHGPGSTGAGEIAPIIAGPPGGSWDQGAPPMTSYVDHTADVPMPLDAPADDLSTPPPPDPGPPAATVDPITDDGPRS
ncbi:hypothetical protein ACQ86B_28505 (plasmid) [Mycolicibacterium aichiense]|uniref:hypothetical protein n=1 Tax=Mycolicibacterium aichiense TaxID=1799 RepID=UPI003D6742C4